LHSLKIRIRYGNLVFQNDRIKY